MHLVFVELTCILIIIHNASLILVKYIYATIPVYDMSKLSYYSRYGSNECRILFFHNSSRIVSIFMMDLIKYSVNVHQIF